MHNNMYRWVDSWG